MIITTSSTATASTKAEEISTISTGRAYQQQPTLLVIRRRSSAMLLGTFSWTDLAIVVQEDGASSMSPPSPHKRRHVDINSTNGNNEIRRRTRSQSQIVIRRPSIQPEVANFPWTDLAIIIQE
jgi:hypothetical protein